MLRVTVVLCALAPLGAAAQSTPRQFEVASIRQHDPPCRISISTAGSTLTTECYSLFTLVGYAFDMKNYQVAFARTSSLPADTAYDIAAKSAAGSSPTAEQFRQMLQSLLIERFKLRTHREMRETDVYALVVAKSGSKLKLSPESAGAAERHTVSGRSQTFASTRASMEQLVSAIANAGPGRPVVDRTGLTGPYDVSLTYTPESRIRNAPESDPNDISIFTAVQEQLGLKLEPRKEPVEILVVDSVERPSEN